MRREAAAAGKPSGYGYESGSTAVVAVLRGDDLFVANAGDSRAVLCRSGAAFALTDDHKPSNKDEYRYVLSVFFVLVLVV